MDTSEIDIVRRHFNAMLDELLEHGATRPRASTPEDRLPVESNVVTEHMEQEMLEGALQAARNSEWEIVGERDGETYRWPEGLEEYWSFGIYDCTNAPLGQYAVGSVAIGDKDYWGTRRPYKVVFKLGAGGGSKMPIAVFVAADDFDTTSEYVAVIRGAGGQRGQRMFAPDESLPSAYDGLRTIVFRDRIAGGPDFSGYNRLAVVASEHEIEAMLRHAAIQVALRH